MQNLILFVWAATLGGLGLLAWGLHVKLSHDDSYFFQSDAVFILNTAFASLCLAGLAYSWGMYARRVWRSNRSGKRWSTRRLKAVQLTCTELTVQLVNAIFFLVPNAHVLASDCAWFDDLVNWSAYVRW